MTAAVQNGAQSSAAQRRDQAYRPTTQGKAMVTTFHLMVNPTDHSTAQHTPCQADSFTA